MPLPVMFTGTGARLRTTLRFQVPSASASLRGSTTGSDVAGTINEHLSSARSPASRAGR